MGDEVRLLRKMMALDWVAFSRVLRKETGDRGITGNDVLAWEHGTAVPPSVVRAIEAIDKRFCARMGL